MNPEAADMDEVAQYWLDEAEEALSVLHHLFEKSDYSYALFFGHLAVEKLLKSAYVSQKKEHPPLFTACLDWPVWPASHWTRKGQSNWY